uniref:Retrovirus-related Pol polyprotein from transposon TNT 1-94 n=1 Tax=Tanacetum cinerariifolium TaxID=118510 RepID=A0A699H9X8_TANCI|nr:hypothetical protein [Tanacetum cinerariifolium]
MILNSVQNGPLVWPTIVEENGTARTKKRRSNCYVNKAMVFLRAIASLRFPSTNNQLRTSSNLRTKPSFKMTGLLCNKFKGGGQTRVVKCYNYQGEGHMARQCTQPKRKRNAAWFKEKALLTEAHKSGQILDEEKLAFLADLGIPNGQATQTTILNTAAF